VVSDIQNNWDRVLLPSADRSQWHDDLQRLFSRYSIWNYTDFTYDKCHTYAILLHPGSFIESGTIQQETALIARLGGTLTYLVVNLSVGAPYFRVRLERRAHTGCERPPTAVPHRNRGVPRRGESCTQFRRKPRICGVVR
jgi:hypothetical protein